MLNPVGLDCAKNTSILKWISSFDFNESNIIFLNRFSLFINMAALCLSKPSGVEHSYGVADVSGRNRFEDLPW